MTRNWIYLVSHHLYMIISKINHICLKPHSNASHVPMFIFCVLGLFVFSRCFMFIEPL